MQTRRRRGFTLIELIVVMLIISFGLLGLTSLFSNSSTSLTTNETLQLATQYAQGCAERVIATRRNSTFSAISFPSSGSNAWAVCDSLGSLEGLTGYTRNVTRCHTVIGTSASTCPNGVSCGYAVVTVYPTTPAPTVSCPADAAATTSVTSTSPSASSHVTIMLVDY